MHMQDYVSYVVDDGIGMYVHMCVCMILHMVLDGCRMCVYDFLVCVRLSCVCMICHMFVCMIFFGPSMIVFSACMICVFACV